MESETHSYVVAVNETKFPDDNRGSHLFKRTYGYILLLTWIAAMNRTVKGDAADTQQQYLLM